MFEPGLVPKIMAKSAKLSASGSGKEGILPTAKWFNFYFEDDDFEDMCHGFVPKNTVADKKKCVRLLQSWGQTRNLHFQGDKVTVDFLLMDDHTLLAKWLCCFSTEACKIAGELYPHKTLQHFLMGIQRHIRKQKENQIILMTDKEFIVLRYLLDSLYCRLHAQGVGCNVKPTEVLTQEDEEKLLDSGVLNQKTPQGLLNCVLLELQELLPLWGVPNIVN